MTGLQRQKEILSLLRRRGGVDVEFLCRHFDISPATVRRDLDKMSKGGMIRRTYGGAVLSSGPALDSPFALRERENIDVKRSLAAQAIRFLQDGQTIFMDSSTTVGAMAEMMLDKTGLTVITTSIKTALVLSENPDITVYCAGGMVRKNSRSVTGAHTADFLRCYYADFAFISCSGADSAHGVTEASAEEAHIKREMLSHAEKTVLLCSGEKVGRHYFSKVCDLAALYRIYTSGDLPQNPSGS